MCGAGKGISCIAGYIRAVLLPMLLGFILFYKTFTSAFRTKMTFLYTWTYTCRQWRRGILISQGACISTHNNSFAYAYEGNAVTLAPYNGTGARKYSRTAIVRLLLLISIAFIAVWGFKQGALATNDFNDGSQYVNGIAINAVVDGSHTALPNINEVGVFTNKVNVPYILLGKWMPQVVSRPVMGGDASEFLWPVAVVNDWVLLCPANLVPHIWASSLLEITSRWLS